MDIEDSEDALLNSNNVLLNSIENEDIDHKPNQVNEPLEEVKELHNENINRDANQNDRLNQIDKPLEELNDFHNENVKQDASQNDKINQIDKPLEEIKDLHNENAYPNANNDDKKMGNDGLLEIDNYYQNKKIDSNLHQDNQQIEINESAEDNKNMDNDLNKDKDIFIWNQTCASFQSKNKRRYMQTEESKDGYKVQNNFQNLSTNKKRIQKEMQYFENNVKKIELTEDRIALIQNRELNASENLMKSIKNQ